MSLYRYVAACDEFALELEESLSKAEIDALRDECAALGIDGWLQWFLDNRPQISAYVAAVPSSRVRKKPWQDTSTRRKLVLAGIQHVQRAHHLLGGIDEYDLFPGGAYRDMAAKAGEAYIDIFFRTVPYWPFDDPDPFDQT